MKHNTDKYNVAWYRLSECVAKGERERALGMYRLLAHSIDNTALVKQLEGDILYLFNDPAAFERYKQAAYLYQDREMYLEAAALLEQVVQADIFDIRDCITLVSLYQKAISQERAQQCALQLLDRLIADRLMSETIHFLHGVSEYNTQCLTHCIIRIAREDLSTVIDDLQLRNIVKCAVDFLLGNNDTHAIDRFIQLLNAHNPRLHQLAQGHLDR